MKITITLILTFMSMHTLACSCMAASEDDWGNSYAVIIAKPESGHLSGKKVPKGTKEVSTNFRVIEAIAGPIKQGSLSAIHQNWNYCIGGSSPYTTYLIRVSTQGGKLRASTCTMTTIGIQYPESLEVDAELSELTEKVIRSGQNKLRRVREYMLNKKRQSDANNARLL